MNHNRPINLDLTKLKFPVMAISSILHRLSGLALFLLLPFILYCLNQSLNSSAEFNILHNDLNSCSYKVLLWLFGSAFIYHAIAGIRHIIMDFGYGESLTAGRRSAWFVLIIAAILIIGLGAWIC